MPRRNEDVRPSVGHLTEDDIIDATHGLTSADERADMGRHADVCPDCRSRLREALADRELAVPRAAPEPRRTASRALAATVAAAAAAAAILVALAWGPSTMPRGEDPYIVPPVQLEASKRSIDSAADMERLGAGIAAYARDDLDGAISILGELRLSEGPDGVRTTYLASALVRTGRAAEAREMLESSQLEFFPFRWRDRAKWILYPLVRDDDPEQARRLLTDLGAYGGEFATRAARELRAMR